MLKYQEYDFSIELIKKDLSRLINQIWKLLPMRENGEDWQKQLTSVMIEINGLHKMFGDQLDFLIILSKLNGLDEDIDFMEYRTAVFSVISLMTNLKNYLNGKS